MAAVATARSSRRFADTFRFGVSCAIAGPPRDTDAGALVVPSQQDVDAPMAVSDASFRQLANTLAETGLLGTTMPVVVGRTLEAKSTTGRRMLIR